MKRIVDLRSDTTTRPTPAMRQAMMEAEVGDDVFGDDPSINRLQEIAADRLGKEAALFLPTGSMSNAAAIKTHTKAGDEILMDTAAHSMIYEVGMPATIANVVTRQFRSDNAVPDVAEIESMISEETLHSPGTTLLVLENTHNRAGGAIIPLEVHRALWKLCQEKGVRLHLDGARLFNAVVATQTPVKEYAANADSVTFCLSKGLGCPVGSVLCGTAEFIQKAKRVRKMLGGGMRQAGFLAAAGIFALDHHIDRLAEDHRRAKMLAEGLANINGAVLDTLEPPTNMIYLTLNCDANAFAQRLRAEHNVLVVRTAQNRVRMVTHLDIDDEGIAQAVEAIRFVCSN